jgi:hypothetical protein
MNISWKTKTYISRGGFKCRRVRGLEVRIYKKGRDEKKFGRWDLVFQDDFFPCFSVWPFVFTYYDFPDRKFVADNWEQRKPS